MIITGQLLREIYTKVIADDAKRNGYTPLSTRDWEDLNEEEKRLYTTLADELNKKIEQEAGAS